MCTGLEFVLALPVVFAPMGFPSTLFCNHAAVKPTICDMLLNHENFGTDTLLPTPPSESRENLQFLKFFEIHPLCRFLRQACLKQNNYPVHIHAVVMLSHTLQRPGCRGPWLRLHHHIHN